MHECIYVFVCVSLYICLCICLDACTYVCIYHGWKAEWMDGWDFSSCFWISLGVWDFLICECTTIFSRFHKNSKISNFAIFSDQVGLVLDPLGGLQVMIKFSLGPGTLQNFQA